jgi:hypothetical protein
MLTWAVNLAQAGKALAGIVGGFPSEHKLLSKGPG